MNASFLAKNGQLSRPERKWALTMGENGNSELAMINIELELFSKFCRYEGVGDELQLKISKAGNASRFEKNLPPEVLRVIEGANHH